MNSDQPVSIPSPGLLKHHPIQNLGVSQACVMSGSPSRVPFAIWEWDYCDNSSRITLGQQRYLKGLRPLSRAWMTLVNSDAGILRVRDRDSAILAYSHH